MAPKKKADAEKNTKIALGCAGVVVVVSLAALIIGIVALYSQNLRDADKLVNADTDSIDSSDGVKIDITKAFRALAFLGGIGLALGGVGAFGIHKPQKVMICTYIVLALLLSIIFLLLGVSQFMIFEGIEPTIERQVDNFCNATTYSQIRKAMTCDTINPDRSAPTPPPGATPTCGVACQERVDLIKGVGGTDAEGCEFLERACTRREFTYYKKGFCQVPKTAGATELARPSSWQTAPSNKLDLEGCGSKCGQDVFCTAIVMKASVSGGAQDSCNVITKSGKPTASTSWLKVDGGSLEIAPIKGGDLAGDGIGASCYTKGRALLVSRLQTWGRYMFITVICFGAVMCVAVVITFIELFTLSHGRAGKPTLGEQCFEMFCPCLEKHEDDEESLASGDEEESRLNSDTPRE